MIIFDEKLVEQINGHLGGFNKAMGLRFTRARPDEFVAEIVIEEHHLQPYGLVHGGIYSSMIETLCSTGAALNVLNDGKSAVGLENNTSFLRAVRSGTLRCTARPLVKGRRSHVWEARIQDERDRLVATGRVRMIVLDPDTKADGGALRMETNQE